MQTSVGKGSPLPLLSNEWQGRMGMAAEFLTDTRTGRNTQHGLVAQLRQSVYSRLAGYEDTNDAEPV